MPLRIEIVSPEKRVIDRRVDMAVVPGIEGDIAAMPDRAPLMLQLRGGVVALYENDKIVDRYFVSGGFADMAADRCTILADNARLMEELSADSARARLHELEAEWTQIGPTEVDMHDRILDEIQSVRAELEATGDSPV